MSVSILKQAILPGIASASCVEYAQGNIYIIGDDSHYLYVLKYDLTLLHKIPLTDNPEEGRIAKEAKTDIECITKVTINGYLHLVLLGSGSKSPSRDKGFLIKLPTPYNKKHIVWPIDCTAWYSLLRLQLSMEGMTAAMNLEAAAADESFFYLADRSSNTLFRFDLPEVIEFVQGHLEHSPFPTSVPLSLPILHQVPYQITGADVFDATFFFTATAEDTDNPIDDGEILGSAIGILEMNGGNKTRGAVATGLQATIRSFIPLSTHIPLKVESIAIYEKENDTTYIGLAVSDDDKGNSEILMLEIHV
ncbi:MAG: hypothetical protein MUE33_00140 [Cytophagaceae bacterium]|jgi:hypothetical protein|nr:hypothetical protein [Cytophagaceae bacterium]